MALPMKAMKTTMKAVMKAAMKKTAMKKVMKKAMKKAMKKKAMKVSKIAKGKRAKVSVFKGGKEKTSSGLTKGSLMKNKRGKIVSKASSSAGKKNYKNISGWTKAFQAARKALGIKGFCPCGGKTAQGKALYAKAKSLHNA
jgi:hypothetical protein